MATKNRSDIIGEIEGHIGTHGGRPGEWFVGTTENPKVKLFRVHKLKESGDAWISRKAQTEVQAQEVQEYFRTVRKTKGPAVEVTIDHIYVYAYKIKAHTNP